MKSTGQNIENWATQILLEAHAIEACPRCGFKKLKFDHAAIEYAHGLAAHRKPRGLSPLQCVEAVDSVLHELGDECPACD